MKRSLLISVLFFLVTAANADTLQPLDFKVRQEIRYVTNDANSVYLVWGVDNWQLPPETWRPKGSFVKDNLVYTPMEDKSGFSAVLKLPKNTHVDYVFWINRGPLGKTADVWDTNGGAGRDYHSVATHTNVVFIEPSVKIRPEADITILDLALPMLSLSGFLLFLLLTMRHWMFGSELPLQRAPRRIVVAVGIVLAAMLIFCRASVAGLGTDLYLEPMTIFPKVFWAGFYDVLYVAILTVLFLLLFRFCRSRFIQRILPAVFIALSFFSLLAGILNIRMVEMIGKPFSYPWFYYSDFLKSTDAREALAANVSVSYVMSIAMVLMSALFAVLILLHLTDILMQKLQMRAVFSSSLVCSSIVYLAVAPAALREYRWEYEKLANPVVEFAGSMGIFKATPGLFTMPVADSLRFDLPPKRLQPMSTKLPGVKNVLIYVMESTPAEYVSPYSKEYKVTPQLERYLEDAVVFDNIYAHAPATNNSLVSILASTYPWLSYNSLTREYPDIAVPTISSELKEFNYRTSFFNSADNRFQRADQFLASRKLDLVNDLSSEGCESIFNVKDDKWEYLDGKDDACTADRMLDWIRKGSGQPFFTMLWTYQTHYPYFAGGEEKLFTQDKVLNRYLNAVHHSDAVLGRIIEELKASGLYSSTLIVVVGDHGEAFGRHEQTTHASGIYEENLHVPCIFINPGFHDRHHKGVGGLVDIAPTIMNCLGYDAAHQWQGRNLFTTKEQDRVFFFTPWADYLFGFREGDIKYIYNATKNLEEVYDLSTDPGETQNLEDQYRDSKKVMQQRLAGWVQAVNQSTNQLIGEIPR